MIGAATSFFIAINWMRIELKKVNNPKEESIASVI